MSEISVTAQILVSNSPAQAFQRFLDGELLNLECTRMSVGAAVSVALPVGGDTLSGAAITLLGHVAAVRYGKSVTITHHQPWRGHLKLRFQPDGSGTRLILESSLDQDGLAWLAYKRGFDPPEPLRPDRHRIGLLVSKSGSAAVFAQATETLAHLAVEEINAGGGIGGMPVELLIGDDASDSLAGAVSTRRLLNSGCRAVFACVTSATFGAAASVLRNADVLLVHTVLNEGGRPSPGIVRLGERPRAQVQAGMPALMAETGAKKWFFVGHRYSWSYGAHWAARQVAAENHALVLGDTYVPLGTTDFSEAIFAIAESRAELILSSLVGHDEVLFEQQCLAAGLRTRTRTLALVLDEATQQLVGEAASDGVWTAFRYFHGIDDGYRDLETRYSAVRTGLMPPMSSLSETTYEAIASYARILGPTGEVDAQSLRQQLSDAPLGSPAGAQGSGIVLAESKSGILIPRDKRH